jgi:GAF domain-containing protein
MMKPGEGETDPLGSSASWVRAVTLAASAADVEEALAGILNEGGGPAGAAAGAVLEVGSGSVRAAWRCEGYPVQALARRSAEVRAAVEEAEEWPESTRVLEVAGDCDGTGFTHLLLAPLRRRGTTLGVLLLLYQGAAPPRPRQRAAAGAIAALAALVVENDRLYEEAREALQARDHFLTALNHELRTPATSLMLASDVLRSGFTGDLPPRLERVLQEAEEHVRRDGAGAPARPRPRPRQQRGGAGARGGRRPPAAPGGAEADAARRARREAEEPDPGPCTSPATSRPSRRTSRASRRSCSTSSPTPSSTPPMGASRSASSAPCAG